MWPASALAIADRPILPRIGTKHPSALSCHMETKGKSVATVLLVVAGLVTWAVPWVLSTRKAARETQLREESSRPILVCDSCSHLFRSSHKQLPPLSCPKCGKETGFRAEFAQCGSCQKYFPTIQLKWSPTDKTKWETRLQGNPITPDEQVQLDRAALGKNTTRDWMPAEDLRRVPFEARCPHCGNQNRSMIITHVQPPTEQ